jgi:hypothetical protein
MDTALTRKQLVVGGFTFGPTGIVKVDGAPTFAEWKEVGKAIRLMEKMIHWIIGDWLNYGERTYGQKYQEAEEQTGFEYGTLANDKYVAGQVEFSRRRENLSWAHHAEVAALESIQQDIVLLAAEQQGLTRQDLRRLVRHAKQAKDDAPDVHVASGDGWTVDRAHCLDWFARRPADSVGLVFGSPPYEDARWCLEDGLCHRVACNLRRVQADSLDRELTAVLKTLGRLAERLEHAEEMQQRSQTQ